MSNAVSTAQVIAEEDAPLRIIGTKFQKNPFTILSLADGGNIATPQDLVGKKIGVQAGGNETLFDALLEVNGIDPASVEKVPVEYDPAPPLQAGHPSRVSEPLRERLYKRIHARDAECR